MGNGILQKLRNWSGLLHHVMTRSIKLLLIENPLLRKERSPGLRQLTAAQPGSGSSHHACDASIWACRIVGSYGYETFTQVSADALGSQNMCGRNRILPGSP